MKILFKGNKSVELGSERIFLHNLNYWFNELGYNSSINASNPYTDYDVVIFGKNIEWTELKKAKDANPKLLIGRVNPTDLDNNGRSSLRICDFLIVGSIIEKDYYLRYNDNVFILPLIERGFTKFKKHTETQRIVLGYHGNLQHLNQFDTNLIEALEEVSKSYNIELCALYNIKELGKWKINRPNIPVKDIQWELESVEDEILKFDIGLIPSLFPINEKSRKVIVKFLDLFTNNKDGNNNDYITRYKTYTNAGRAFVFHQLGIPVVSDFAPTSFTILDRQDCGFLVHSKNAWIYALRSLIESPRLRNIIAANAAKEFNNTYDPLKWADSIYKNISKLSN